MAPIQKVMRHGEDEPRNELDVMTRQRTGNAETEEKLGQTWF